MRSLMLLSCLGCVLSTHAQPLPRVWPGLEQGAVLYCTDPFRYDGASTPGNPGELIVAWSDMRDGLGRVMLQKFSDQDPGGPGLWDSEVPGLGPLHALAGPVCDVTPFLPWLVSDGAGGALVLWQDMTGGYRSELHIQRVGDGTDGGGDWIWPQDLLITDQAAVPSDGCRSPSERCRSANSDENKALCGDGAGGAWVLWRQFMEGLRLTHVEADGSLDPDFPSEGLVLPMQAYSFRLCGDGLGNALIFYNSGNEQGEGLPLSLLGVRPDGSLILPGVGRRISSETASIYQFSCQDGTNGRTLVAWSGAEPDGSLEARVQLLDAGLQDLWTGQGVPLGLVQYDDRMRLAPAGADGPIHVAYHSTGGWLAQRLDASGHLLWGAGVSLDFTPDSTLDMLHALSSDGEGLVCLLQHGGELLAQRLDAAGTAQWPTETLPLGGSLDYDDAASFSTDGGGGLLAAWSSRVGAERRLVLQHRRASGESHWPADEGELLRASAAWAFSPTLVAGGQNPLCLFSSEDSLFAQRLDVETGERAWGFLERPLSTNTQFAKPQTIRSNGSTWVLGSVASSLGASCLRLQAVDDDGQAITAPIAVSPGSENLPDFWMHERARLVASGDRIYVFFEEETAVTTLRAQCFTLAGERLWGERGLSLHPATGATYRLLADAAPAPDGGADVLWTEWTGDQHRGYLQHLDPEGQAAFPENNGRGHAVAPTTNLWISSLHMKPLGEGARLISVSPVPTVQRLFALDVEGNELWSRTWSGYLLSASQLDLDSQGRPWFSWREVDSLGARLRLVLLSPAGDELGNWSVPMAQYESIFSWLLVEGREDFALLGAGSRPDGTDGLRLAAWQIPPAGQEPTLLFDDPLLPGAVPIDGLELAQAPQGDAWVCWSDARGSRYGYGHQGRLLRLDVLDLNSSQASPSQPTAFGLLRNRPNPFNPETWIEFSLATAGPVRVDILNLAGQRVRRLQEGRLQAGFQRLRFDGRNEAGAALASGLYFCRLQAGEQLLTSRMLLVR